MKSTSIPDRYRHADNRRRLNVRKVQTIRRNRSGLSVSELARKYGVSYNTVRSVLLGRTWKGVY